MKRASAAELFCAAGFLLLVCSGTFVLRTVRLLAERTPEAQPPSPPAPRSPPALETHSAKVMGYGYYRGCTVFLDSDGDRALGGDEPAGDTAAFGNYSLVTAKGSIGGYVRTNADEHCINTATAERLQIDLLTPWDASVMNTLTSVGVYLLQQDLSQTEAHHTLAHTFQLQSIHNHTVWSLDPYEHQLHAIGGAERWIATEVQTHNALRTVVAALAAASSVNTTAQLRSSLLDTVYTELAGMILATDATLRFTDRDVISHLLTTAAAATATALDASSVQEVAELVAFDAALLDALFGVNQSSVT